MEKERVAAVMPVHLYGQCAEMTGFAALAKSHGMKVVEDAAQAFGAAWEGVRRGVWGMRRHLVFILRRTSRQWGMRGWLRLVMR